MILALGDIKKAGNALNNEKLLSFRSKMIIALIFSFLGIIFITVGVTAILAIAYGPNPGSPEAIRGYIIFRIMILAGLVFLIVALVLEILAWGNLKTFFKNNTTMFPEGIGSSAKTGCLLMQLGAIPFIGPILRVVGFFFLSKLKNL